MICARMVRLEVGYFPPHPTACNVVQICLFVKTPNKLSIKLLLRLHKLVMNKISADAGKLRKEPLKDTVSLM